MGRSTISFIESAQRTIAAERDAVNGMLSKLDHTAFNTACELMLNCKGRVVITGMGKSGHIGNKIAATLASTGTPSFFVHPGEAAHGDMGMITADDVVIALSNSGESSEVTTIILLPVRSPAGFIVQPIVGIIAQDIFSHLHPDPAEVESIFTVPLTHIGQSDNFTKIPRQTEGRDNSYWVVAHPEHYIWGLSARVLNDLRQRLYHGQTLP